MLRPLKGSQVPTYKTVNYYVNCPLVTFQHLEKNTIKKNRLLQGKKKNIANSYYKNLFHYSPSLHLKSACLKYDSQ